MQGRFFDASEEHDGAESVAARYVLERELIEDGTDKERFRVLRPFGYRDHRYEEPFVVPVAVDHFTSDLASIPLLFRWLVPVVGGHLPAALLHDALCESARRRDDPERLENHGGHLAHRGPSVDRIEADRIFRDAMGELGVSALRRWLMWTAVVLATAVVDLRPRWRWWLTVFGTIGVVCFLGVVGTLDLINVTSIVPWMGDRPAALEVVYGAIAAIVIPVLLSLLWGRLWAAGMIAGITLALLFHVTVATALLTLLYRILERIIEVFSPRRIASRRTPDHREGPRDT